MLRFDSPGQVAWNLAAIALWLVVVIDAIRRWRGGRPVSTGQLVAIFLNFSVDGTFVPIGAVAGLLRWLIARGSQASEPLRSQEARRP